MTFHLSAAQRSASAKAAAATRRARGIKSGFARMSSAQRSAAARKSIATKKARGEKIGFANETSAQRHANAVKAAATRRAEGLKPFGGLTAAQLHLRAVHAAATRRAEGILPFGRQASTSVSGTSGTATSITSTATSASTAHHQTINPHRHRAGRLTPATHRHLGHIRRHHKVGYHPHLVRHRVTSHHTTSLGGTTGRLGRALNPYTISRKKPVQLHIGGKAHTPKRPPTHAVISRNPRRLHIHA